MREADLIACRDMIRGGSRSFFAASRLLPARVSAPAFALYAFCRAADDAVDGENRPLGPASTLDRLRERLDGVYRQRPQQTAVDRAFAEVVARFQIPRVLPEALLEGFSWDLDARRYDTPEALEAYAARVAGSVGAMMSLLMGATGRDVVARACDLGVAMQLTNIARDVGEDARMGRVYLPLSWLADAGVRVDRWLARPGFEPAIGQVVARLLRHADLLYGRARSGIALLPAACRPGITAASALYCEIGREVERRGCDSISTRARVASLRKAALIGKSLCASVAPVSGESLPPLRATKFLVDAVPEGLSTVVESPAVEQRSSIAQFLGMLEKLERQDRTGARRGWKPAAPDGASP